MIAYYFLAFCLAVYFFEPTSSQEAETISITDAGNITTDSNITVRNKRSILLAKAIAFGKGYLLGKAAGLALVDYAFNYDESYIGYDGGYNTGDAQRSRYVEDFQQNAYSNSQPNIPASGYNAYHTGANHVSNSQFNVRPDVAHNGDSSKYRFDGNPSALDNNLRDARYSRFPEHGGLNYNRYEMTDNHHQSYRRNSYNLGDERLSDFNFRKTPETSGYNNNDKVSHVTSYGQYNSGQAMGLSQGHNGYAFPNSDPPNNHYTRW